MIIDAHAHIWSSGLPWLAAREYQPIQRDFGVDDLRAELAGAAVDACVLVESGIAELAATTRLLEVAADTREVLGVVGWASLIDPYVGDIVGKHRADTGGQLLVAIRDHLREQPDDFLDRPDVRSGLRAVASNGAVNELAVRTEQLPSVARAAAAMPDVTFVLDHLGSPWLTGGPDGVSQWLDVIRPVARCNNVVAKLSGLVTLAHWDRWNIDDLRPYVDHSVELFGTNRLMYGSDWPVCQLAAPYKLTLDALVSLLGGLPADVFAATAIEAYHLEIIDGRS
jgi:L-fuconolactonase